MNRKRTLGLLSLTAMCMAQASWAAESQDMGQTKINDSLNVELNVALGIIGSCINCDL